MTFLFQHLRGYLNMTYYKHKAETANMPLAISVDHMVIMAWERSKEDIFLYVALCTADFCMTKQFKILSS